LPGEIRKYGKLVLPFSTCRENPAAAVIIPCIFFSPRPVELEAFREILSSYREILFRGTMDDETDTLRREIIEKSHPLVAC